MECIFIPSPNGAHTIVKCLFGWMDGRTDGWVGRWLWRAVVVRKGLVAEGGQGQVLESKWDRYKQKGGR